MRTSATGRSEAGFTLLELLVVLVIIGVGIATTVVALRPDPRGVVRVEGDRLALLLGLASEESATAGKPLAWVAREGGYEFQARELSDVGPDWNTVRGDELLHARDLPGDMVIRSVQVDGVPLQLGQRVGLDGVHDVAVEIASGAVRARISGKFGHYSAALVTEDGG